MSDEPQINDSSEQHSNRPTGQRQQALHLGPGGGFFYNRTIWDGTQTREASNANNRSSSFNHGNSGVNSSHNNDTSSGRGTNPGQELPNMPTRTRQPGNPGTGQVLQHLYELLDNITESDGPRNSHLSPPGANSHQGSSSNHNNNNNNNNNNYNGHTADDGNEGSQTFPSNMRTSTRTRTATLFGRQFPVTTTHVEFESTDSDNLNRSGRAGSPLALLPHEHHLFNFGDYV